jgi:hypothetical protein
VQMTIDIASVTLITGLVIARRSEQRRPVLRLEQAPCKPVALRTSVRPSPEHRRPAILGDLGYRTTRNAAPSPRLTRAPLR